MLKSKIFVPIMLVTVALALPIFHPAAVSHEVADKVITSSVGKEAGNKI
ncbi:hypothetical protein V7274_09100 [Bacillus pumilus]|nr:hypothetical protein [Bacillus pumilus]